MLQIFDKARQSLTERLQQRATKQARGLLLITDGSFNTFKLLIYALFRNRIVIAYKIAQRSLILLEFYLLYKAAGINQLPTFAIIYFTLRCSRQLLRSITLQSRYAILSTDQQIDQQLALNKLYSLCITYGIITAFGILLASIYFEANTVTILLCLGFIFCIPLEYASAVILSFASVTRRHPRPTLQLLIASLIPIFAILCATEDYVIVTYIFGVIFKHLISGIILVVFTRAALLRKRLHFPIYSLSASLHEARRLNKNHHLLFMLPQTVLSIGIALSLYSLNSQSLLTYFIILQSSLILSFIPERIVYSVSFEIALATSRARILIAERLTHYLKRVIFLLVFTIPLIYLLIVWATSSVIYSSTLILLIIIYALGIALKNSGIILAQAIANDKLMLRFSWASSISLLTCFSLFILYLRPNITLIIFLEAAANALIGLHLIRAFRPVCSPLHVAAKSEYFAGCSSPLKLKDTNYRHGILLVVDAKLIGDNRARFTQELRSHLKVDLICFSSWLWYMPRISAGVFPLHSYSGWCIDCFDFNLNQPLEAKKSLELKSIYFKQIPHTARKQLQELSAALKLSSEIIEDWKNLNANAAEMLSHQLAQTLTKHCPIAHKILSWQTKTKNWDYLELQTAQHFLAKFSVSALPALNSTTSMQTISFYGHPLMIINANNKSIRQICLAISLALENCYAENIEEVFNLLTLSPSTTKKYITQTTQ